jgi:PAS domain S-box-containing protein
MMASTTDTADCEHGAIEAQDIITETDLREDISSRRAAQQALADSTRNYGEIFNSTGDALIVQDEMGRIIDVNDWTTTLFKCDRQSMIGLSVQEFSMGQCPYSEREFAEKIRRATYEGSQVFEWLSKRHGSELFWTEFTLRATKIAGQNRLIASGRDVSDRKRAEEALRESEQRFRTLSSLATEGLLIHENGTILDADQAFASLIGAAEPKELIGKQGLDVIGFTPDSRRRIIEKLQSGSTEATDIEIARKDGTVVPAETWGRFTTYRGRSARLCDGPLTPNPFIRRIPELCLRLGGDLRTGRFVSNCLFWTDTS